MNRVTYSGNPACSEKLPRRCFGTECGPRRASCPAITLARRMEWTFRQFLQRLPGWRPTRDADVVGFRALHESMDKR